MNYSMFYWKILWFAADAFEDGFEREICDLVKGDKTLRDWYGKDEEHFGIFAAQVTYNY